jgi:hypothetical protein
MLEMRNKDGYTITDVTVCKTNIQSDTTISNKIQINIDKKSNMTSLYFRISWYNKPCIKALLIPEQNSQSELINEQNLMYGAGYWHFNINSTQYSKNKWGRYVKES